MATTFLPGLPVNKKSCTNRLCKSCGLYLHQLPVLDKRLISNVFWVGLSAVIFSEDQECLPLSPLTASGRLIQSIEQGFTGKMHFYKTNLVKCAPLKDDKIRYPLQHEMEKCYPNFEWELENLQPKTVFLLGKQVSNFVMKQLGFPPPTLADDFSYTAITVNGTDFIPIHHPSYILVYKRKWVEAYMDNIQAQFPVLTTRERGHFAVPV
jgi:DNA polymerase